MCVHPLIAHILYTPVFLPSLSVSLLEKEMASFAIEDFIGNGSLQGLLPKLLEEGWDDVPTLKIMNADDMNELNMTQRQKVLFTDNSPFLYIPQENHLRFFIFFCKSL